jgi:hypothetical protein
MLGVEAGLENPWTGVQAYTLLLVAVVAVVVVFVFYSSHCLLLLKNISLPVTSLFLTPAKLTSTCSWA